MKGAVLAAGMGTRLGSSGMKPLIKVGPYPLILYPLRSLARSGIDEVVIIANKRNYKEISKLAGAQDWMPDFDVVLNNKPEWGNGYSALLAAQHLSSDFVLSMSDHLYTSDVARVVASSAGPTLGVDSLPRFIDVGEATKVRIEGRLVKRLGKGIGGWDAVDIGVHHLDETIEEVDARPPIELSDLLNEYVELRDLGFVDVRGAPWTEIDTREDLEEILGGGRRAVLEEVLREW